MLELAKSLEQSAPYLSDKLFVAPGIIFVAAGLFLWLGGLGYRRPLAALAGAAAAVLCALFISGQNLVMVILAAVVGAVLAVAFEKILVSLITVFLAAGATFIVLAYPHMNNPPMQQYIPGPLTENLGFDRSILVIETYSTVFGHKARYAASRMGVYNWAIVVVAAAAALAGRLLLRRFASALTFATLGTIFIFGGMVWLLFYKPSTPVTLIAQRASFYLAVFAAMIAFGTVEQLLLCPVTTKPRLKDEDNDKKEKD